MPEIRRRLVFMRRLGRKNMSWLLTLVLFA
jgi:hypothetical protein